MAKEVAGIWTIILEVIQDLIKLPKIVIIAGMEYWIGSWNVEREDARKKQTKTYIAMNKKVRK